MKKTMIFEIFLLLGVLFSACKGKTESSALGDAGDFANWDAWNITWKAAEPFVDVTVKIGDEQKTYAPQQDGYCFLAVQAEMINTSKDTQEMRFPKGPIYLTDKEEKVYDLAGVAEGETILMAPPYTFIEKTYFSTTKWDTGFFTVTYQPAEGTWFIQASSGANFHVDFLFTIPSKTSGFVLHFGNGMLVNIN
jgi:hypothetical protein